MTAAEAFLISERWMNIKCLCSLGNLLPSSLRMGNTSWMVAKGSLNVLWTESLKWRMEESTCWRAMLVVCLLSAIFFLLGLSAEVRLHLATGCTLREIEVVVGVETGSSWGWGEKRSVLFVLSGNKEVDSRHLLDDRRVELEEGNWVEMWMCRGSWWQS